MASSTATFAPMGASARSIHARIFGGVSQRGDYPHDGADFDRCEAYLTENALHDRLSEMASVNAYWRALVSRWSEIQSSADKSASIKSIIGPIQKVDPSHARLNEYAHITTGPITFGADLASGEDTTVATMTVRTKDGPKTMPFDRDVLQQVIEESLNEGKPRMKDDDDFRKHNQKAYDVTADELRQFVERFEQLESEKKDVAEQQKELMAEAKGRGYDTKVMRKVVALRKRKPDDIAEEEAVLEMYKQALGMA